MKLRWIKREDGEWCGLDTVNLSSYHFVNLSGVYVVWFVGAAPNVVRVGQGDIADRLEDHRNNPEITQYSSRGKLFATWASVPEKDQDGVEVFLAEKLMPLEGERFPGALPIEVNLPGKD